MPRKPLSIRVDLANGERIGPGKIELLEAVRDTGSISGAARQLDMSYRRAWLLIEEINAALDSPAVTAATGGKQGGGAALTPVGEEIVNLYRSIEHDAQASVRSHVTAIEKLSRKSLKRRAKAD